jgi:hypothetical protein
MFRIIYVDIFQYNWSNYKNLTLTENFGIERVRD